MGDGFFISFDYTQDAEREVSRLFKKNRAHSYQIIPIRIRRWLTPPGPILISLRSLAEVIGGLISSGAFFLDLAQEVVKQ